MSKEAIDITPEDDTPEQELVKAQSSEAIAHEPAASMIQIIERAAMNPDVDIDKMERLMQMKERMDARDAETEFNIAMTGAQQEMSPVAADANGESSRYASYAALDRALRPVYTEHGFALSFGTEEGAPEQEVRVVCHTSHVAGHTRRYHIDIPADGKGPKGGAVMTRTHATGSATLYGMRYLLKMIFNIAIDKDDDGKAASAPVVQHITDEQALALEAKINDNGIDKTRFHNWLSRATKAEKIANIKVPDYQQVMQFVDAIIKDQAK